MVVAVPSFVVVLAYAKLQQSTPIQVKKFLLGLFWGKWTGQYAHSPLMMHAASRQRPSRDSLSLRITPLKRITLRD
jgi:hypothetical protein